MRSARICTFVVALFALSLVLAGCGGGVNGSVNVPAGTSTSDVSTVNGSVNIETNAKATKASTVNGSIHVARKAQVGKAHTVNGSITLGEHATAGSIDTVNGGVKLAKNASVSGDDTAVNGTLRLAPGSAVNGKLRNVNSKITVDDAHVGQGITTVNGDIDITGEAVVAGGITVKKPNGILSSNNVPRITIGPGATVKGPLTFERPVKLFISDKAHVSGPISGAQAVKFSGKTPPSS